MFLFPPERCGNLRTLKHRAKRQVIYTQCTMMGMICMYRYIQRLYTIPKTMEKEKLNGGKLYSGIHSTVGSDNIIFVDGPGIILHK